MSRRSTLSRVAFMTATSTAATLCAGTVRAAESADDQPVDVVLHEAPPPRRTVSIELNPVPLVTIHRLSANVVIVPRDHHALVVSPFYAWTTTAPIYVMDALGNSTALPAQSFDALGGELGYRYYFGLGGPRGLFLGPSLLLAWVKAGAQDGADASFLNFGLAADVGYQTLVADRVALSAGVGLQYTATSKTIPDQQFPAELYANAGVRPRFLLSCGWAF